MGMILGMTDRLIAVLSSVVAAISQSQSPFLLSEHRVGADEGRQLHADHRRPLVQGHHQHRAGLHRRFWTGRAQHHLNSTGEEQDIKKTMKFGAIFRQNDLTHSLTPRRN